MKNKLDESDIYIYIKFCCFFETSLAFQCRLVLNSLRSTSFKLPAIVLLACYDYKYAPSGLAYFF